MSASPKVPRFVIFFLLAFFCLQFAELKQLKKYKRHIFQYAAFEDEDAIVDTDESMMTSEINEDNENIHEIYLSKEERSQIENSQRNPNSSLSSSSTSAESERSLLRSVSESIQDQGTENSITIEETGSKYLVDIERGESDVSQSNQGSGNGNGGADDSGSAADARNGHSNNEGNSEDEGAIEDEIPPPPPPDEEDKEVNVDVKDTSDSIASFEAMLASTTIAIQEQEGQQADGTVQVNVDETNQVDVVDIPMEEAISDQESNPEEVVGIEIDDLTEGNIDEHIAVNEEDKKYLNEDFHEPEIEIDGILPSHLATVEENKMKIVNVENDKNVNEDENKKQRQTVILQNEEDEEEEEDDDVVIEHGNSDLLPSFDDSNKVLVKKEIIEDEDGDLSPDGSAVDASSLDCDSIRQKSVCDQREECKWLKPKSEFVGFYCVTKIILPCTHSKFATKTACESKKGCEWTLPTPTSKYHKCLPSSTFAQEVVNESITRQVNDETRAKAQCKHIYIRSRCMIRRDCNWKYPKTQKVGRYCSKATKEEIEARESGQSNYTAVQMIDIVEDILADQAEITENVDDKGEFGVNQMTKIADGSSMLYDETAEVFNFANVTGQKPTSPKTPFSWKNKLSDAGCSKQRECGVPSTTSNLTKFFGNEPMKSFQAAKCCEIHVQIRIMMHAVADFFDSIAYPDWWIGNNELVGMHKHNGIMLPYQNYGVINFALRGGQSMSIFNMTMQSSHAAYVNEMTKFNEHSKYLPFVLRACASKFPSPTDHSSSSSSSFSSPSSYSRSWLHSIPSDLKCYILSKSSPVPKSRTVQFFILSHMDDPFTISSIGNTASVFIIPRMIRGKCVETWRHSKNCERMVATPINWILPSVTCPYLFYGREMKCPKWIEQYLDINSDNWRESGHGNYLHPPMLKSPGSRYVPSTWVSENPGTSDKMNKIYMMRQWLSDDYCPSSDKSSKSKRKRSSSSSSSATSA